MQRSGFDPPAVHQIIGSLAATDISEASANPAPFAFLRPRRGCALALGKSEGMAWLCASVRTQAGHFTGQFARTFTGGHYSSHV